MIGEEEQREGEGESDIHIASCTVRTTPTDPMCTHETVSPATKSTHRYVRHSLRRTNKFGVAGDVNVGAAPDSRCLSHLCHKLGVKIVKAGDDLQQ